MHCASHYLAHHLIIPQHLFTTTFRASMLTQTRPIMIGTSEFYTQLIWSIRHNDSKLQMLLFWRIRIFWSPRTFWNHMPIVWLLWRIGNIIGRIYCQKNRLKVRRSQSTHIPAFGPLLATHNSHLVVEKHNSDNDSNSGSNCDGESFKEDCSNCENLVIKTHRFPNTESLSLDSCIIQCEILKNPLAFGWNFWPPL